MLDRALERMRRANGRNSRSLTIQLGDIAGPMVIFAAATGLRPGEWIALEWRDIDPEARVMYVRRAFRNGNVKCTKTTWPVCSRTPLRKSPRLRAFPFGTSDDDVSEEPVRQGISVRWRFGRRFSADCGAVEDADGDGG